MSHRELPAERLRRAARRGTGEGGSATVLAVGVIAALLTVTLGALVVLGAVRSVHVARSAADLGALAAAGHFQVHADPAAACREADRIARRHEARVLDCSVGDLGVVTVTASVPIRPHLAGVGPDRAEGTARAGPAGTDRAIG
ncbi:Rv3654c family TadE-like protein [Janibacter sp. DB-40]|uniref:Rv3654c family TadE-like protein n=1 Tax=Janibacter sp. DB-40 TaxID=3028808 RepID=UPI002405BD57|nr:Rv3654c family TadE-like protein [Janibacter sp. DB-40]